MFSYRYSYLFISYFIINLPNYFFHLLLQNQHTSSLAGIAAVAVAALAHVEAEGVDVAVSADRTAGIQHHHLTSRPAQ